MDKLEYQNINDKFYNFGSSEYVPLTSDITNKLKSNNILMNLIDIKYKDMFNMLRRAFGDDKVTWGIKNVNGKLEFELYFYSFLLNLRDSKFIVDKFLDLPDFDSDIPFIMWSVDINDNLKQDINFYRGYSDFRKHIGSVDANLLLLLAKSYSYNGESYKEQNTYYFWKDSLENIGIIKAKIFNSPFVSENINVDDILIPEFLEWYETNMGLISSSHSINGKNEYGIVTSNKEDCSSIYYMALNVDMLLIFLKRFNYPQNQIDFIEFNKDKLNHLLYDISFNYRVENNKLKILKSGYYGQI